VIYSLLLDERTPHLPRFERRRELDEILNRPFGDEDAKEYDRLAWGDRNIGANPHLTGDDDDPFLAKPVVRA
jgi:hypothetical protein